MLYIALTIYAAAMTAANLSIAAFGLWVVPINAFLFIGLDLSLRDWLHTRISKPAMLALICGSGALTYALNPAAGQIALASATAFVAAAAVDWLVFTLTPGSWVKRANVSNVAGAAVDSLVFPAMTFGINPVIVVPMFLAKVAGGALWSWLLSRKSTTV